MAGAFMVLRVYGLSALQVEVEMWAVEVQVVVPMIQIRRIARRSQVTQTNHNRPPIRQVPSSQPLLLQPPRRLRLRHPQAAVQVRSLPIALFFALRPLAPQRNHVLQAATLRSQPAVSRAPQSPQLPAQPPALNPRVGPVSLTEMIAQIMNHSALPASPPLLEDWLLVHP